MRILADENVVAEMVEWLRSTGHEVLWAAESMASQSDDALLAVASKEGRVLLTRDRDFGEWVFRLRRHSAGVILMRLHMLHPRLRLRMLQRAWPDIERSVVGHFVVLMPGRLRIRSMDQQS